MAGIMKLKDVLVSQEPGSAKGNADGTPPGPDVPPGPVEAEREGAPALD